jgi:hypothetical protein
MKNFKCLNFCLLFLLASFCSPLPLSASSEVINYKFIWPEGTATMHQKIDVACRQFGCNADQLKRVANCESTNNPKAINRREPGQPSGLFQYKFQTWLNFSQKAGIPNADIWDADAQIYTTSWAFSNGLSSHWACK